MTSHPFDSEEEESRLLAHCNAQLKPLLIAALHLGFRKSELLSLRWGNIDFRNRSIKVEASYTKISEAHSAPMTETLTATLKKLKMSDGHGPTASVLRYRHVTKTFARRVACAGIFNFTLYDSRHTFASRLVMAGVDLISHQG